MSYSRWGASRWYTFWANQENENRDTALFEICPVAEFTAAELRADIQQCIDVAKQAEQTRFLGRIGDVSAEECAELRGYMTEFLVEMDAVYPPP